MTTTTPGRRIRQADVHALLSLAIKPLGREAVDNETLDTSVLLVPSYAAMQDCKRLCELAVKASIESAGAVDALLSGVVSSFPSGIYPAMLSIRDISIVMNGVSQTYTTSLHCLTDEVDAIKRTASANHHRSISAIQALLASESSLMVRLFLLTNEICVIVSQYFDFLQEHAAALCIVDQRIDSDMPPIQSGLRFYDKKIAAAHARLISFHKWLEAADDLRQ